MTNAELARLRSSDLDVCKLDATASRAWYQSTGPAHFEDGYLAPNRTEGFAPAGCSCWDRQRTANQDFDMECLVHRAPSGDLDLPLPSAELSLQANLAVDVVDVTRIGLPVSRVNRALAHEHSDVRPRTVDSPDGDVSTSAVRISGSNLVVTFTAKCAVSPMRD